MIYNFVPLFYTGLTVFLLNVFIYILLLLLIFSLIFLVDLKFFKSLTDLKFFGNFNFFTVALLLSLLSLAGIPPLLGFCGKFFFFIYLFFKKNILLCFFAALLNIFYIFFYIQNLRFVNTGSTNFLTFNFIVNELIVFVLILLTFINVLGFFFIEDIYLYCAMISSFIF